jgi:hypothetical protein
MKYLFAFLFLITFYHLDAQNPGSDAVFQKITKEYTLLEDGSQEFHYSKRLKLLTHFSFNRLYGETFIIYNPEFQELKVNFSQTTHKDGKVTESPFNAYNEVLPRFAADAPYYNHLKEMVVTHPGTELGAVIEIDYTITTKPGYFPGLMSKEIITESSPIQEEEIIIHIPSSSELNYKVLNLRTAPEIKDEDGRKTYTFTFKGIRESSHEYHQPDDQSHLPGLIFSTVDMKEAKNYLAAQKSFDFKTNEEIKELTQTIRKENNNDLSLILDLHKAVYEDMNTYDIPIEYTGFSARHPLDTWKSNGGTPLEKSLLLVAILREAGIHAEPVVAIPTEWYVEEIGCLQQFDEFLVQINPRELEQIYLSAVKPAAQNMVFQKNGYTLSVLNTEQPFVNEIEEGFENKVVTNGTLIFNDSLKYSGSCELLMTEATNPYYQLHEDSGNLKSFLKGISGKEILDTKIINMAQFRSLANLKFESKKPLENQKGYYFFELPVNKQGTDSWRINYLESDRTDPFEIPFIINEQYSYEITLPENTELINPVPLTEMKTEFGEIVLSTGQEGNQVMVKRMLVISDKIIEPGDYPKFKEMMDLWNNGNKRKLVLKK